MPGRIKRISAGVIALALLAVTAGGAYWFESRRAPSLPTIALIPQTAGGMVWDVGHLGATEAAEKLRYRLYWNAPTSESDTAGQVSLIEKVSRGNYAGLVLAPNHPLSMLVPVRHVLAAGLPVVVVSAELDLTPGDKLAYIANDEEKMGELAAAEIALLLKGKGEIALAGVARNAPGVVRRARSAERFLAGRYPGIQVVARIGWAYNASRAEEVMNSALDSNPELKGILSFTAVATRGVRSALKARPAQKGVTVVACEQDSDLLASLRTGEIAGIVAEDSYRMGYEGVEMLAAMRAGKTFPVKLTVAPLLITKANMDAPETSRLMRVSR